jgi:hypothetical protein
MKIMRFIIALLCLAVPVLFRYFWFYQGSYQPAHPVSTPEYASYTLPQPVLSTPLPATSKKSEVKPVIVFDQSHTNYYLLSEIEHLTREIDAAGARIELNTEASALPRQLKYASAYVSVAPTLQFSAEEKLALTQFVQNGGRLLVITDPTRNSNPGYLSGGSSQGGPLFLSSTDVANLILEPYGMAFMDDYVYNMVENEGNFRNVILKTFTKNPLTENISKVVFYSSHSIKSKQPALISGDDKIYSSITDQGSSLGLAGIDASSQVVALGDLSFITSPYDQVADNQVLIANLARFLVQSAPAHTLADYPYLFKQPVAVLAAKPLQMDDTLLKSLSGLQTQLNSFGLKMLIADEQAAKDKGTDLLVLGTFPPDDTLKEFVADFNLNFSSESGSKTPEASTPTPEAPASVQPQGTPTPLPLPLPEKRSTSKDLVDIPGFGKIVPSGIGLVLYKPGPQRNTLVLLAESQEQLLTLLRQISSGSLDGCTTAGMIAVCGVGKASSDSGLGGLPGMDETGGGKIDFSTPSSLK